MHLIPITYLLIKGVPVIASSLSGIVEPGVIAHSPEFIASVIIHIGLSFLLLAFFSHEVRACFYDPNHDKGLAAFPVYLWAKEFVEEQDLACDSVEEWPSKPPTRSEMIAAFGLGVMALVVGLGVIGIPVIGFGIALGAHAIARWRGLRPPRPLSWHLAFTTVLVVVVIAFLSVIAHIDDMGVWVGEYMWWSLGLFTDAHVPLAVFTVYVFSLIATLVVVTYIGMYYLLMAYDSWRLRAGLLPTAGSGSNVSGDE